MISKKAFDPLVWAYQLGTWGRFMPFVWDRDAEYLFDLADIESKRKEYIFWKLFAFINLLNRFVFTGYIWRF